MQKSTSGLGKAGRALWRSVTEQIRFDDPREATALTQACLLADDLARLREQLAGSELIVQGSTGQPVESPLLGAIRLAVALQAKLLSSIAVETDAVARSHAGRALVAQRWVG